MTNHTRSAHIGWAAGISSAVTATGTALWIATQDPRLTLGMAAISGCLTCLGLLITSLPGIITTCLDHRIMMERTRAESYRIAKTTDAAVTGPADNTLDADRRRTDARSFQKATHETTLADTLDALRQHRISDSNSPPTGPEPGLRAVPGLPHRSR